MSSLFKTPKIPKPTPPEPAPAPLTVNQDVVDLQTRDRLRKRKGRAATLLSTGPGGDAQGSKTVLGQ